MTSTTPDMALMQYLFDRDDPMLKEHIKEDVLMKESYANDTITVSTNDCMGLLL